MPMHADELPVSAALVRDLVAAQFPRWRDLPVSRVASPGTVNAIFRLGDRLAARFPLQGTDPAAVRRALAAEGAAAGELAAATRFPVPEQVAVGEPGPGYPLPWSVQAWLPGRTGDEDDPSGSAAFAADLAEFIAGVRSIPARGRAFSGRGRGGDLRDHDAWLETCFARSEGLLDVSRLRMRWIGHHLHAEVTIVVGGELSVRDAHRVAVMAEHALLHAVPRLTTAMVHADPAPGGPDDLHALLAHHRGEPGA